MAVFDDVRLPPDIEKGALLGPEFDTSVVPLVGGNEQRNQNRAQELLRANIAYGMMPKTSEPKYAEAIVKRRFNDIVSFFRARRGKARGFRFKDWSDFQAQGEFIGLGDGIKKTFQLVKVYGTGNDAYVRKITRPVNGSVVIYVDGVVSSALSFGNLGTFTFNEAPEVGAEITWSGEFDVPVRFDTDIMQVQLATALAGEIPDITIVGLPE